jgi:hypothetical protein
MRRLSLLLTTTVILVATTALPAGAVHDVFDEEQVLIPWQHRGEIFAASTGTPFEIGARWGACTPGLAQSFATASTLDLQVGDEAATWPSVSWSKAVNPETPISGADLEDCLSQVHHGTGWWVYWVTPITFNTSGCHDISLAMSINRNISDGIFDFDAGFGVEGTIFVEVDAPGSCSV